MAIAQTTALSANIGWTPAVNGTLALTTTEKEWAFTSADRPTALQLIADAEFIYATQAGGPYTLIPSKTATKIIIPLQGASVFIKVASGTATAYSSTAG